ncbi:MAG: hypothetical protein LBU32_18895, partial [Clostridiales bacterium]|nr:hypothetical protein [Clostridiales bacterium]
KLRFTTKDENIKPFVYLRHGQMSIKCIFVLNYLFWSLIIQRVQNADFGISHHSMDNQAPKKEHLMKSGIIGMRHI